MIDFKDKSFQKGQTLLIVVLIMVVSLTIGLSIASKTITNLRTTTEEADSAKALSAAETGVAQSIKSGVAIPPGSGFASNNTTFSSSVISVSGTSFLVNGGNIIPQDEGVDVWLIAHDSAGNLVLPFSPWAPAGGTLTVYWGDSSGDCNNAALEIIKITGSQASPVATRYAYDPCNDRASVGNQKNNFTSVSPSGTQVSGKTFYYSTTKFISVTNGLLVRIIPLYTNATIAVSVGPGNPDLPTQGSIITSSGKSANIERKINVVANYSSLPSEFFSYGLFVPK